MDKMAELDNPLVALDKMICKYGIHLTGEAVLITNFPEAKYSGGMKGFIIKIIFCLIFYQSLLMSLITVLILNHFNSRKNNLILYYPIEII